MNVKPLYGIKTGLNRAFLIDTATRERLIAQEPACTEILKPFLGGQDIDRWWSPPSGEFMIVLKSSSNFNWPWSAVENEEQAERVFATTYPVLHRHMKEFEEWIDPTTN